MAAATQIATLRQSIPAVDTPGVISGWTPLMMAVGNNRLRVVKRLLENYADPAFQNGTKNERTAFHIASQYGRLRIMKLLFAAYKRGIYRRDIEGGTCLHDACGNGKTEIVKYLLQVEDSEDHSYVTVLGQPHEWDTTYSQDILDVLEEHYKRHQDESFMLKAKKMRASLNF